MRFRKCAPNARDGLDVEIEHPLHGWIPFTASAGDIEWNGRAIYAALTAHGGKHGIIKLPAPPPTVAETMQNEIDALREKIAAMEAKS